MFYTSACKRSIRRASFPMLVRIRNYLVLELNANWMRHINDTASRDAQLPIRTRRQRQSNKKPSLQVSPAAPRRIRFLLFRLNCHFVLFNSSSLPLYIRLTFCKNEATNVILYKVKLSFFSGFSFDVDSKRQKARAVSIRPLY